jgi:hypothetical protein
MFQRGVGKLTLGKVTIWTLRSDFWLAGVQRNLFPVTFESKLTITSHAAYEHYSTYQHLRCHPLLLLVTLVLIKICIT